MPLKLITFLGLGNYDPVLYTWKGSEVLTDLFCEALVEWIEPDAVLVALTVQALEHRNWRELQQRLEGKTQLQAVAIPSGQSEAELWQIFEVLTDELDQGDTVVFDITHAFRSLPMITLLAVAYLRVAKQVKLESLLYGAYEARVDECAPVFELTEFIELLDWLTATDAFLKRGNALELAELLAESQADAKVEPALDRIGLPYHLEGLSEVLTRLTNALLLAQQRRVSLQVSALIAGLKQAEEETEHWAKPFELLLEGTRQEYGPLAGDSLTAQRNLVDWYFSHGHALQAVTLAREWLVNWCAEQIEVEAQDRNIREELALAISNAASNKGKESRKRPSRFDDLVGYVTGEGPQPHPLTVAWRVTAGLRNTLAHCGLASQDQHSAEELLSQAKQCRSALCRLPL